MVFNNPLVPLMIVEKRVGVCGVACLGTPDCGQVPDLDKNQTEAAMPPLFAFPSASRSLDGSFRWQQPAPCLFPAVWCLPFAQNGPQVGLRHVPCREKNQKICPGRGPERARM